MAHTNFKHGIPYNNVKLGGDVAQWSMYEESSTNNSNYQGIFGIGDVSLGDMQRASSANVDPDGDRVQVGPLSTMRYGIAVKTDVSTGDGVYTYQVGGTASDFVGTRVWNRASNPTDIRLSRFTAWDYTAAVHPTDMDPMDFYNGGSTIWVQTARYGCELFKDYPIFVTGVKQSNSERRPIVIRTGLQGDKFSNYPQTNFEAGTHASDMNDILNVVPLVDEYGTSTGTAVASYATIGRRTSSTGNGKVQAYSVTLNSNGTFSTATTGTAHNMSVTGVSSNYANSGACYIDDGLFAVVGGRGNGRFSINRVTWNGSSFSSTSAALSTSNDYGADRGDVVSLLNNFGSTNKWCAAVWTETKSSFNRYVRIQMFNMNSGISTQGSEGTVFDVNNSLKVTRATLLASNPSNAWVLVGVSDSSGDVRLKVMRYNVSGANWTALDDATYQYNDTSLNNLFSLTTLTAVQKTAVQTSGEDFVPGQSNDYKRRVYFALSVSTSVETDDVELQYGYYDIDADLITFTVSGVLHQGKNASVMKNHFGTDAREWGQNLPLRTGAGPVFMPIIGGRYVSTSVKNLSINVLGLDYKPDWSNSATGDPGSTIFDTIGNQYTTNFAIDEGAEEATWEFRGRFKVIFPHPHQDSYPAYENGYSLQVSQRDQYGFQMNNVSRHLEAFTSSGRDVDGNKWDLFYNDELIPYINSGGTVYIRLSTSNGLTRATFTVSGQKRASYHTNGTNGFLKIDWQGNSNGWSGNEWTFLGYQTNTSAFIGIEFSQDPF